jgi:anti-sigma factor RsiW
LSERSTQVASSDQHTVKPWLSARLDYSPPVRDLVAQGYPLIGARIERVGDRDVAVLVYHYRLHGVDVYVRPDWPRVAGLERRTIRGFNVLHMTGQGMDWLAVSDASFDALVPFLRELANPSPSR